MYFAAFYNKGLISGTPQEACGDRSVIILDGRERKEDRIAIANATAKQRGYCGFSLHRGDSFTRAQVEVPYQPVH